MILGRLVFFNNHNEKIADLGLISLTQTPLERAKGLLKKKNLENNEGLWINPCNSIHTLGMKFPIDLIFFNSELKVIRLKKSVKPKRFSICLKAKSILEIKNCMLDELKISEGCYAKWNPYK